MLASQKPKARIRKAAMTKFGMLYPITEVVLNT